MSPGYPVVHVPLAPPFFGLAVTSGDLIPPAHLFPGIVLVAES